MASWAKHVGGIVCNLMLALSFVLFAGQATAQSEYPTVFPRPVLVLDQEELFNGSKLGQAILFLEAENRTILLRESRTISDAFEAEEAKLTQMRAEVSADEFRILSDDFDQRVQAARENQLEKDVQSQQTNETRRRGFLSIAAPYLSDLMIKYRASAVIDRRSVLLFNRDMDITLEAIALLDQAFEENPDLATQEE